MTEDTNKSGTGFHGLIKTRLEEVIKKEDAKCVTGDGAIDKQIGGNHYKSMAIQPVEFIDKNGIGFIEGCVIKYVCRHQSKNGVQDIDKAIHFLKLLKELRYEK